MRAVVISTDNKIATVLGRDGIVSRISNEGYSVGEELELKPVKAGVGTGKNKSRKVKAFRAAGMLTRIAAIAAALVITMGAVSVYAMPCSTVTMDVNPSISYGVNLFDRVVRVDSYNDEGSEILSKLSVKGMKLEEAIDATLDAFDEAEYIDDDTDVVMTVDSRLVNRSGLEERVRGAMDDWNIKHSADGGTKKSINPKALILTDDLKDRAREKNVSPGRIYMEDNGMGRQKDDTMKAPEDTKKDPAYDVIEEEGRPAEDIGQLMPDDGMGGENSPGNEDRPGDEIRRGNEDRPGDENITGNEDRPESMKGPYDIKDMEDYEGSGPAQNGPADRDMRPDIKDNGPMEREDAGSRQGPYMPPDDYIE